MYRKSDEADKKELEQGMFEDEPEEGRGTVNPIRVICYEATLRANTLSEAMVYYTKTEVYGYKEWAQVF